MPIRQQKGLKRAIYSLKTDKIIEKRLDIFLFFKKFGLRNGIGCISQIIKITQGE